MLRQVVETWEVLRIVVEYHHISCVETIHLMGQHERSFVICVIGDDEAFSLSCVRLASVVHMTALHQLHKLGCLASRGGAHVEDGMLRVNSKQQGR
jgi:hypothetical protein